MTETEMSTEIERLSLDLHEARETIARREAVIRVLEKDADALIAELDALRDFVKAKMHHLPIEDQHASSIFVSALEQGEA